MCSALGVLRGLCDPRNWSGGSILAMPRLVSAAFAAHTVKAIQDEVGAPEKIRTSDLCLRRVRRKAKSDYFSML